MSQCVCVYMGQYSHIRMLLPSGWTSRQKKVWKSDLSCYPGSEKPTYNYITSLQPNLTETTHRVFKHCHRTSFCGSAHLSR